MSYASVTELRDLANIGDNADDALLTVHIDAASEAVDLWCGRTFVVPTAATARRFHAHDLYRLVLPPGNDISSTTGLVVATDDNDDGTAETTWTITTDFELGPWSGVDLGGQASTPYTEIVAVGSRTFPVSGRRPKVSVTARWGWPAVPDPVKEATLALAHRRYLQARNAPLGVAAMGDFGPMQMRDRPDLLQRLSQYRRVGRVYAYGR